ncbi:unnamed protein product [Closterium sp. NIES-53]
MESLLTEVESLAPRFASGDVASLDPLAEALANLLARSRERDWLTEESESLTGSSSGRSNGSTGAVGSRIAITRLVAVVPELSRHCPELHGIFHPADVADAGVAQPSDPANGAPFGAANDGPHGLSTDPPSSSVWAVHALRPLLHSLRVVRNLLAGSAANQDAFLRCGAVDLVATIADRLILSRDMYAAPALRATKAHIRGDGRSREDGGDSQGKGIMGGSVGGEAKAGGNVSKSDVTKLKEMGSVSSLSDALASLIAEVGGSAGRLGETENKATSPEAAAATSATAAAATSAATDMSGASPATAPKVAAAAVAEAAEGKQPSADGQLNSVHPGIPPSLSTSPPLPLPPHIGPSPFPHPTSLSTFTPTAAPSGPRFPHSVPLPVNHLDTLKTVLQLLGNFCGGGRKQQQAVWDRCFPGTFSRIAAAGGAAGRAAGGMLLAPSYQVGHASHMPSNEVPHNEATSARHILRFSLHCLRILAALDPVPAAEPAPLGSGVAGSASTDLLSAVGGLDLIPLLLDLLHGLGPPAIASAALTATRETTAMGTAAASNAPHKAPGSIRNPEIGAAAAATFPPGPTALYPWCNPIPVSAAASGAIAAAPGGAVGGGGAAAAAAAAAAADDDDDDDNSATATDATKDSSSNPHPTGNPTPAITPSSNIMSSGLFLVLQQCVTGDSTQGDDLLREWGLWAVRNLLEANPENAADVAALEVRGGAQTEGLREMGLAVEVDERSGRPKLRNIGADER